MREGSGCRVYPLSRSLAVRLASPCISNHSRNAGGTYGTGVFGMTFAAAGNVLGFGEQAPGFGSGADKTTGIWPSDQALHGRMFWRVGEEAGNCSPFKLPSPQSAAGSTLGPPCHPGRGRGQHLMRAPITGRPAPPDERLPSRRQRGFLRAQAAPVPTQKPSSHWMPLDPPSAARCPPAAHPTATVPGQPGWCA